MVKEERSLRTRHAAGSKRRIARRSSDNFSLRLSPAGDPRFFAMFSPMADSRERNRLNATTKPTTPMRPHYLATVEADALPDPGSVHPALVAPPLPLRMWLAPARVRRPIA